MSDSLTDLLAAPVVDELHLIVGPVVLGGGTPAFGSASAAPLRLLGTHTWRDSGTVLIRYAATDRAE